MKRAVLVLGALLFVALASSATPLTVSWADGKIDLQKGTAWTAVGMGDKIDSSSTLRLASGASVELTDGKRKVSLTAAGTYQLDALLKKGAVASKKNAGTLDKLGKLVDPKATTGATTVAAVRGAAVEPGKDSVTWQSDSTDVQALMEEGRKFVRDGDFAAAAKRFGEAAFNAEGDEKDSAHYAQAWALAADESSAQAVAILRSMPSQGIWAAPRALLLARLDIDSGAKVEAKALLESGKSANIFVGDDVDLAKALLSEATM